MDRIWTAFRAFFVALFDGVAAAGIEAAIERAAAGETAVPRETPPEKPAEPVPPPQPKPTRSDALTLLAALQREGRFIDFIQEPLDEFPDAQIGSVARDVQKECRATLQRMFAIAPLTDTPEGHPLDVPAEYDPGLYRLTGKVAGEPPFRGEVAHHGWKATRCELPQWTGSDEAAEVIAPMEVEVS